MGGMGDISRVGKNLFPRVDMKLRYLRPVPVVVALSYSVGLWAQEPNDPPADPASEPEVAASATDESEELSTLVAMIAAMVNDNISGPYKSGSCA